MTCAHAPSRNENAQLLVNDIAATSPEFAGRMGVAGYDDKIADLTEGVNERTRIRFTASRDELAKRVLSETDPLVRQDLEILVESATNQLDTNALNERLLLPYINLPQLVFFGIFTLVSGPWADRWGRRRTLIGVTIAIAVFGLLWVPMLAAGPAGVTAWLILGFSLMGITFGPMGAFLPELFPANVRYTGSGISYNVSSILGAAMAPFVAVALWTYGGGSPFWVGIYLSAMAVITLVALVIGSDTKDVDIEA